MDIDLSGEVANAYGKVISWIPDIIGALIILIIGYIIAKILQAITIAALNRIHLNKRIHERPEGTFFRKITENPSKLVGAIVYWLVWIIAITVALPILNIPVISQLIYSFYAYLPNILAAIIIILVATAISAGIDAIILKLMGNTVTGKILATATPTIILTIATFMVLVQLGIATPIILITYGAIWGALALGFALAFGLGGRDTASRLLEDAYTKGKENINQAKRDLNTGKERGEEEINRYK